MANEEHIALLRQDMKAWDAWREEDPDVRPDLHGANLRGADLREANLVGANLLDTNLVEVDLIEANLSEAILTRADLHGADLTKANLCRAALYNARLNWANLNGANLNGANLSEASLIAADFTDADLTSCTIFGVSAWKLKLGGAKQQNLIITHESEPEIIVDNIEVAQFIYLLLHNQKIRDVIDTITSKAVLILGRFTPGRKEVLDALRNELRNRGYVPILFDFDKPASQDLIGTVSTLAHMARFIIADITDPSSIPLELATVVPTTPIPVQPILLSGKSEFSMLKDLRWRHDWVLPTHHYDTPEQLIADLNERVIRPAENKVLDLQARRPK
jgi:hypothetical protein